MKIIRTNTLKPLNIIEKFYFKFKKYRRSDILFRIGIDIQDRLYKKSIPKIRNVYQIYKLGIRDKFRSIRKDDNSEWFNMHYIDPKKYIDIKEQSFQFYNLNRHERREISVFIDLSFSPTSNLKRWEKLTDKYGEQYRKLLKVK